MEHVSDTPANTCCSKPVLDLHCMQTRHHPLTHTSSGCLAVTQIQIEVLYRRFRSLDRARKGFISAEEFLGIPELSINPLAQRLVRMFESVNFREFVKVLSAFSPKASRADKITFMFQVYDVDGDGEHLSSLPACQSSYDCVAGSIYIFTCTIWSSSKADVIWSSSMQRSSAGASAEASVVPDHHVFLAPYPPARASAPS
jgi:hypothetical protein